MPQIASDAKAICMRNALKEPWTGDPGDSAANLARGANRSCPTRTYRDMTRALGWIALPFVVALVPTTAEAALWRDVTATALGTTGGWTNKVDLADLNGDGRIDILFANGGNYNEPGDPTRCGVWINEGTEGGVPKFADRSVEILGDGDLARVIKARDVNGDGIVDILVGNTYERKSRLYLGKGGGVFEERSELLPDVAASVGDLEVGDMDGDGDLDIVLADWGLEGAEGLLDPFTAPGAPPLLWRNELDEPAGAFVDASAELVEAAEVAWAWELELVDVDADFDLDVMLSSKVGEGSALFRNDDGRLAHDVAALPRFTNNYDFEPMLVMLPGTSTPALAVVTINDGTQASPDNQFDLRERIFVADARGNFADRTATLWPDEHNAGADDNMVVVLDFDSDGDPDFLIGALGDGPDRLHVNELADEGVFVLDANAGLETGLDDTPGTLGIALADLNGDAKLDVVQSQGELADPERVWLGDEIAADTAAPKIAATRIEASEDGELVVRARVHDDKSPSVPSDWQAVVLRTSIAGKAQPEVAMAWMGEFYWRAELPAAKEAFEWRVCATDAAGNETCSDAAVFEAEEKADDLDADADDESAGCRIAGAGSPGMLALVLLGLAARRRRARR